MSGGGPERRRRLAILLALAIGAIIIAVVLGMVLGGGSSASANAGDGIAGCSLKTYPSQGRNHVTSLPKGFSYNSFPPSSGPHYPIPLIFNLYDQPLQQMHLVHNLEHGAIAVQYGNKVPQAVVTQLTNWYNGDTWGLVVAPLPVLGDKIALTAWTHVLTCPGFSEQAFDQFKNAYRDKGPESPVLPKSRLNQGSN